MAAPPRTQYAKSGRVNIAYQVLGEGPVDLLWTFGWISHIELAWENPAIARFFRRLASFGRLIVFDKRGTGLSDAVPVDRLPTLEQRIDDVRAVMGAGEVRALHTRQVRAWQQRQARAKPKSTARRRPAL